VYTGPLDSEVVDSMNDCDPEVRHTRSAWNLLNIYFTAQNKSKIRL